MVLSFFARLYSISVRHGKDDRLVWNLSKGVYDTLYTEQSSWRPRVDGIYFSSIDADECLWLERVFEEQEVWEVVRR
jgi:hypothetical protein